MISSLVRKRVFFAGLAAFFWIAANLVVCFEIIVANQTRGQLTGQSNAFIRSLDNTYAEIDATFASLDVKKPASCTPDQILRMKRAMFRFPHVQDILLFEDDSYIPKCSAMLGRLSDTKALPKPEPLEYTRDDAEVWFNLPLDLFDGRVASYVVKEHHYAVTANMSEIRNPGFANPWETFVPKADGSYGTHADGQRGLYQEYLDKKDSVLFGPFVHLQRSQHVTGAIVTTLPLAEAIRRDGIPMIVGVVIALLSGVMVYFLVSRWLLNRGAPMGRIKSALRHRHGFSYAYQPIISLPLGRAIGCEVLSRFEDELGVLRPDEFIPIVMKLNKTWEFTEMMMETSLRELEPVLKGAPDFKVSVNVFPRDLANEHLARISSSKPILHAVSNRIPLNFEILETGFSDARAIAKTLAFFRALNFTVAIDDFGTGSSNLHELRDIHAHYIKIDKSFVQGLAREDSAIRSSLIPHIVDMAKAVHAEVIAEGAETSAQVQLLCSLKIKYVQGYFFSRPVPFRELQAFVAKDGLYDQLDQEGLKDGPSATSANSEAAA